MKPVIPTADVWLEFFEKEHPELEELLQKGLVRVTPLAIEERFGKQRIELLRSLPAVARLSKKKLADVIAKHRLKLFGLSEIHTTLLAIALNENAHLWTRDRQLRTIATVIGVCYFEKN